jgi:multidrug efflux pump subunit AcrA (membrane-fusion protein)
MANFIVQLQLEDSYNRQVTKRLETETDVLATAITAVASLATDLAAVTDLALIKASYSNADVSAAFAGAAGSNIDVGATFRLRTTDGGVASYRIPGFDVTLANADGSIDPTGAEVVAYFDNFKAAGSFTLADGETITEVLSGQLDR